jgi:hypothetical protein
VEYEFSYHLSHLASGCGEEESSSRNTVIPNRGVFFHNLEKPNAEGYGSASLIAIGNKPRIKGMWLRSSAFQFDALSALWREVSTGTFTVNDGSNEIDAKGRNGGSILFEGALAPGESRTYPILIAWHFPNCYVQAGGLPLPEAQGEVGCRSFPEGKSPLWRPYYAAVWKDAREVALYVEENYSSLRARTVAFKEALFSSTPTPAAARAPALMCGIMPRRFLTFTRNWSGLCENSNWAAPWTKMVTSPFAPPFLKAQSNTISTLRRTGSWAGS